MRAVVFDYGMVLTGMPNQEARAELLRITGLTPEPFDAFYWADRHAYDEGKLSGITFWEKFLKDSKLDLPPGSVEELNRHDARMWTTQNPTMVAWQQKLKAAGILTGILSNMGDSVLELMLEEFAWLKGFDVLVWSFQLGIAKPDPEIYRHVLEKLGTKPEETLFIDDREINIAAARALGMEAIEFSTVEKLRADLIAGGFDREIPLPG